MWFEYTGLLCRVSSKNVRQRIMQILRNRGNFKGRTWCEIVYSCWVELVFLIFYIIFPLEILLVFMPPPPIRCESCKICSTKIFTMSWRMMRTNTNSHELYTNLLIHFDWCFWNSIVSSPSSAIDRFQIIVREKFLANFRPQITNEPYAHHHSRISTNCEPQPAKNNEFTYV